MDIEEYQNTDQEVVHIVQGMVWKFDVSLSALGMPMQSRQLQVS
jgi:hypothetical protein